MSEQSSQNQPWWRHGYVWLIIAGPALVVVAAVVTAVIAIRGQDPVIDPDYYQKGLNINKTLSDDQRRQMMPALTARNHAATPDDGLPDSEKKQQTPAKTP
jgi:hypothetical protein